MTIRSWTAEVTAFGVVVRIEQVLIQLPARVFPAIPQSCEREQLPFVDFKTVWLLGFPRSLSTRKIRLRESGTCEISADRGMRASWLLFPTLR